MLPEVADLLLVLNEETNARVFQENDRVAVLKVHQIERVVKSNSSASIKGHDPETDVRKFGEIQEGTELFCHDLVVPHHSTQHGFTQDQIYFGRLDLAQDGLSGQPRLHSRLNLLRSHMSRFHDRKG